MKPYLLKAWGGDQEKVSLQYPPESTHNDTLHWWFDTHDERDDFKRSLRPFSSLCTAEYDPEDEDGNQTDTHKRTIAVMDFKLSNGEVKHLEYDFGYGYPHYSAEYMFKDGNYSCDCNRAIFLNLDGCADDDSEIDSPCGETIEMISFTTKEVD